MFQQKTMQKFGGVALAYLLTHPLFVTLLIYLNDYFIFTGIVPAHIPIKTIFSAMYKPNETGDTQLADKSETVNKIDTLYGSSHHKKRSNLNTA